jgi:TctA family transporter
VLSLVLTPRFGLQGAVIATTLSIAAGSVAAYAVGRRVLALPLPLAALLRCGAAAGAMGAAVSWLPELGGARELLLKASVGGAVYAALVLLVDAAGARRAALKLLRARRLRGANPGLRPG